MRLVVADTGPLKYLVLTRRYRVATKTVRAGAGPQAVRDELANPEAPAPVRAWIAQAPGWVEVQPNPDIHRDDLASPKLDEGEWAAIALALTVKADLLLMDDQDGVTAARRQGLTVIGTLGLLDLAARPGLIDLAAAFERLKATTFY